MEPLPAKGVVKNGQIVLETPLDLPDGTAVTVMEAVQKTPAPTPVPTDVLEQITGMWSAREEMADAEAWVRQLRGRRD